MKIFLWFFSLIAIALGTANYVYFEATQNTNGQCGPYLSILNQTNADSVTIQWKAEYTTYTTNAALYYTTNGSIPVGSKGIALNNNTIAVNATYNCTAPSIYNAQNPTDIVFVTLPPLPVGNLTFILSAWHSGGGDEIYANSGSCNITTCATIFTLPVYPKPTPPSTKVVYSSSQVVTTGYSTTGVITTGNSTSNSTNNPFVFPRCTYVNATILTIKLSIKLCVDVQFRNCEFDFAITADDAPIYSPPPFSITQFKDVFREQEDCRDLPVPGCQACTIWSSIVLNQTLLSGCGELKVKCGILNFGTFNLSCFRDSTVGPRCFGNCPNACNYNGICDRGFCNCTAPWKGDDCSVSGCLNNCGGSIRGTCVNNVCVCKNGFQGDGCSLYVGQSSSFVANDSWKPYVIGFVVSFGGLGIIVSIVIFAIYYRKKHTLKFLDEASERSEESEIELD